jgi:N-acetylglucosaminyl-diphospho-decaprenol L-rhamnosyltransferase
LTLKKTTAMIRSREASRTPVEAHRARPTAVVDVTANAGNAGARFAVVIVNYNGGPMLRDCVLSAVREGVPAAQIVVVDNGSQDCSIENLERSIDGLAVIRNNCNAGFAKAVNQGIKRTSAKPSPAEFVLLLNNDAQLDSGALQAFAHGFDSLPNLAIAGGQLHYLDGRLQSAFAPLPSVAEEILPLLLLKLISPDRFRRKTPSENPMAVECVLGACLCVRSSVLPRLGFLDEDYFFFFEEIEWCQRARQMGAEVYYLPAARAVHGQGQTANRFRGPSRVEYQRSKLTFFRKTRSTAAYFAVSGFLVLRTSINALSGAVMCAATLFLNKRLRLKAGTYWYLLGWHLMMRPATWGLPGKCLGGQGAMGGTAHGTE